MCFNLILILNLQTVIRLQFMKSKLSKLFYYLLVFTIIGLFYFYLNHNNSESNTGNNQTNTTEEVQSIKKDDKRVLSISELTDEKTVINYIKENNKLPEYYIKKNEARKLGWKPEQGNLCEVLPGKAIGGDKFGNRERKLPIKKGRNWFEADINYDCGRRDAQRLVYSNDGLIFITKDHYKTFQKQ